MELNFGLCPFWFWNGNMEDEAIQKQIRLMHEAGVGGFMIQARQGLTVPYLSRQWFKKVALAVAAAKQWGLDVWICDEYPYPSGNAGGQVLLEHPEYAATELKVIRKDFYGPQEITLELPWGEPVWAAAYPLRQGAPDWEAGRDLRAEIGIISPDEIFQLSGLTQYNRKRFFSGMPRKQLHWTVPGGKWRIYLFIQVTIEHQKFFGKFIDPLNPRAVECFIKTTHEKYREYIGNEFGKTVKGFFVDEIEPQPHQGELRWSPLLPRLFAERKGYQLLPNLPALVEPFGEATAQIRYDYWDVITEAFFDSFDKPVAAWCHDNHLLYAGEKPILRSSQLQYFDVPGIDAGHQKVNSIPAIASEKYRGNAKLLGSAAHFYGKPRLLCECFHSVGWGMTLQDMRWMIDWIAVQGVNLFVPHAYFYTTAGLAKHDAPPSSFFQDPAWPYTSVLANHVTALCEIGTAYHRDVEILVLDPITSRWTAMGEHRAVAKWLAEDFARLQQTLLRNHFDFHIVDPQKLAESKVQEGRFVIGEERFAILILPPLLNMEGVAWAKIKEFVAAGGCLIGTGCLPVETLDGISDLAACCDGWFGLDAAALYQNYCTHVRSPLQSPYVTCQNRVFLPDCTELPKVLDERVSRKVNAVTNGRENETILVNHYCKDHRVFILVLNSSGTRQPVQIKWTESDPQYHTYEIITETAPQQRRVVAAHLDADGLVFETEFAPYQSRLFELSRLEIAAPGCLPPENVNNVYWLGKSEPWNIKIPWNTLRLDDWHLTIDTVGWEPVPEKERTTRMVKCRPIINQVAESGIRLPVFLANNFGCPWEMAFPALDCTYHTEWQMETVSSDAWLVMDPGAIKGKWRIRLNGREIPAEAFETKPFYAPENLAAALAAFLKPGLNCLEIKLQTTRNDEGLVNPLYICGDFGVFKTPDETGWCLGPLPAQGLLRRPDQAGLPFYAGTIHYSRLMKFPETQTPVRLGIAAIEEPVELFLNGRSVGVRAWEPFTWELPPEWLQRDQNLIEVRLSTTLLGLSEGSYFDREKHCYREY
jgi:hypothetical protein